MKRNSYKYKDKYIYGSLDLQYSRRIAGVWVIMVWYLIFFYLTNESFMGFRESDNELTEI